MTNLDGNEKVSGVGTGLSQGGGDGARKVTK